MKFGERIRAAQTDNLVITKAHEPWAEAQTRYSHEAIEFAHQQMQKVDRDRRGTVSASGLKSCARAQSFTFLGMPKRRVTAQQHGIFTNGDMVHLRWQMNGLSQGWLAEAEVPIGENDLRLSGTRDGVMSNGDLLEIKSINANGWSRLQTFGVQEGHVYQVATYGYAADHHRAHVLYENKNTQEYREYIVDITDEVVDDLVKRTETIWGYLDSETLPPVLDAC